MVILLIETMWMIDSQLMERYVGCRDSSAFRDLVTRHGPAVLRVCRRFARDPHEAEDAMQATFLLLVERAPSIRDPEQIDRWLTGVARKVAARTTQRAVRRTERERRWAETRSEASLEAEKPAGIEIRRVVREELGQLADADRQPLTLCYLDGLTHEEAAQRIGCPVGTIKARLVRARRKLRDRLDRRGVALSLGLLLMMLRRSTSASADEALTTVTIEAMQWAAAGDHEALEARYPGAVRLMQTSTPWLISLIRAPVLLLILGVVTALLGGGTLIARAASERVEARTAQKRLTTLLDVDCKTKH